MKTTVALLILIFFFTVLHPNRKDQTMSPEGSKQECLNNTKAETTDISVKVNTVTVDPEIYKKQDTQTDSGCQKEKKTNSIQSADYYFVWIVL